MPVLSNRKRLKKNVILIFSYVYVNELLEEDFFFFTIFHNTSLFIIICTGDVQGGGKRTFLKDCLVTAIAE